MDQPSPSGDRNWAVAAYLTALLNLFSAPLPGLVGSFVAYALTRDRGALARESAREALNLQLTLLVVEVALVISMFMAMFSGGTDPMSASFWVLLAGAIATVLASVVYSIIGAVHASRGEVYRYPVVIHFVG